MQESAVIFDTGAATHVGKVRRRNEDSFLAQPVSGIWAVADGMGGHDAGDLASATVIEALKSIGQPGSASALLADCEDRVLSANARLLDISRSRGGRTLGSTVAVLLTYEGHYACVWSGDSRIYRIRSGGIAQLSRDHTEVQAMVEAGRLSADEARTWPGRNVITRAIGVHQEPELEIENGTLEDGDAFVLCSDGLTAHVGDNEIAHLVATNVSQTACDQLISLTLERGAADNVTVIVVRYRPVNGHDVNDGATVFKPQFRPARLWE